MAEYAPGMRVIIRDEEWMIKKADRNSYGNSTLQCVGITPLVKDRPAYFLSDLEKIEVVDPAQTKIVIDHSAHHNRSRLYLESQWRQMIPTDLALHIGHKAVMNVLQYQLEPAASSLKRARQRILIADAVGLGKTLEAGILMSELIARGKGQRILVVTVKSMMAQFQKEMWERFTIPLISLDSSKIQSIRRQMPVNHNPFNFFDKTIVSIDTIKRDVEYRAYLEKARWDIIVIDEAHNVARRGEHIAQRAKLAELLSGCSDTLIMLSATPHDGNPASFASLMNMLDPMAIPDPEHYTEQDIKDSGEDIKGLFVRRFKKDIQDQTDGKFMQRHVSQEDCWASLAEETAFNDYVELEKRIVGDSKSRLKTEVYKKALFSSPAACIETVKNRLRNLKDDLSDTAHREKTALNELLTSLERIEPKDFSRFVRLVELLKSKEYGWDPRKKDDRLVIFTERIATMRWIAEHLLQVKELGLTEKNIQVLHGGMSDLDQQKIVEDFGRSESPIRVLVASDVASEGINLHYLSHRMIHFDIPWSLMVFQQRNGRIDRYGQDKEPDIRYMVIRTNNDKIRGDIRILEILMRKEEQASKNIGDPALIMHVFDSQKEEEITAQAMRDGNADKFDQLFPVEGVVDIFALMSGQKTVVDKKEPTVVTKDDHTMMTDLQYLEETIKYLNETKKIEMTRLTKVEGLEIAITEDMKRRWRNMIPSEAIPEDGYLRLTPNRDFCAEANKRSLQNSLDEKAWPQVHYLWKQHPIMQWANDKAGVFFGRQEAPLVGMPRAIPTNELLFVISSLIPNKRGTPLVDEWFVLRYVDGVFKERISMEQFIAHTHFDDQHTPNMDILKEEDIQRVEALLPDVIAQAKHITDDKYKFYKEFSEDQYYSELEKLDKLKELHMAHIKVKYEQQSMLDEDNRQESRRESRRKIEERKIEDLYRKFYDWVEGSMEIQNKPYTRVIAVFQGVMA